MVSRLATQISIVEPALNLEPNHMPLLNPPPATGHSRGQIERSQARSNCDPHQGSHPSLPPRAGKSSGCEDRMIPNGRNGRSLLQQRPRSLQQRPRCSQLRAHLQCISCRGKNLLNPKWLRNWQIRQKQASGLQTGFFRQQNNSRDGWKKVPFLQKGTFPRCFRVPGIYIYILYYIYYIYGYIMLYGDI